MHGFPELLHFQRWHVMNSAKPKLCTYRLFINSSKQSSRDWHQWNRVSIRDTIIHLAAQNIEWAEIAVWASTLRNCMSVCAWECVEIQTIKCNVTDKQTPFALTQFHLHLEFACFFLFSFFEGGGTVIVQWSCMAFLIMLLSSSRFIIVIYR